MNNRLYKIIIICDVLIFIFITTVVISSNDAITDRLFALLTYHGQNGTYNFGKIVSITVVIIPIISIVSSLILTLIRRKVNEDKALYRTNVIVNAGKDWRETTTALSSLNYYGYLENEEDEDRCVLVSRIGQDEDGFIVCKRDDTDTEYGHIRFRGNSVFFTLDNPDTVAIINGERIKDGIEKKLEDGDEIKIYHDVYKYYSAKKESVERR